MCNLVQNFLLLIELMHWNLGLLQRNQHFVVILLQSASWFCVFEWILLSVLVVLHYRRNISIRSNGSAMPTTDGFSASDTAGVVANEHLPGTSVVNPNYFGGDSGA